MGQAPPVTAPKRRWFRFSLRTLFVLVTLFGCWLGYQLNWIRARRLALESGEVGLIVWGPNHVDVPDQSPPWMLGLLGESSPGCAGLVVAPSTSDAELARIQSLFPELDVERR
jgi:hypothetical protein